MEGTLGLWLGYYFPFLKTKNLDSYLNYIYYIYYLDSYLDS